MTTTDAVRPLGCPEWCELDASEHAPQWHDGALRVDHQRLYGVEGAGVVVVAVEAAYRPEGDTLRLALGPVGALVESGEDPLDAQQLRALAQALTDAAALVDAATGEAVAR